MRFILKCILNKLLRMCLCSQVKNNSAEHEIAKNAVFGRHPWLENMPAGDNNQFTNLKNVKLYWF